MREGEGDAGKERRGEEEKLTEMTAMRFASSWPDGRGSVAFAGLVEPTRIEGFWLAAVLRFLSAGVAASPGLPSASSLFPRRPLPLTLYLSPVPAVSFPTSATHFWLLFIVFEDGESF